MNDKFLELEAETLRDAMTTALRVALQAERDAERRAAQAREARA